MAKDNSMMSALMNCIVSNNEHAFIYLYFKGQSNLNNVDANGNTLLHLAAEHGATNIALMLRHLHGNEVKEEICNTSMEKIQKIAAKSIELH
jgi:ankyrin repeat protein